MKNIAITGYCGTGSSAVIDLLEEYTACSTSGLRRYEHTLLYTPGGMFDLEDKLLIGNDIHRSDEAIRTFNKEMERLNKNNFGWFGSYSNLYGDEFYKLYHEFLNNIHGEVDGTWYGQYERVKFSFTKVILQLGAKIIQNRKIHKWGRKYILREKTMLYSFIESEKLYSNAKKFIQNYFNMINRDKKHLVLDHFLLPHNAYRVPNYFDDNFRLIIVDRDVRDMYILGKYVWPAINSSAPFPVEVDEFIKFWGGMKRIEKRIDDKRILRINFEDLIYKYDETVEKIEGFIGLGPKDHVNKKMYFDPDKSIKNTQNFTIKSEWKEEVYKIEKELKEYMYDFPYKIETSISETFDE